jgi:hypothetical protein
VDVTLQPEVEKMVLDRVRRGNSSTSQLVNAAVKYLLEDEHVAMPESGKPDLKPLELAKDAQSQDQPAADASNRAGRVRFLGRLVA